MIRSSLCSVTFRKLSVEQIIDLAAQAGLDAIEWGGDIHVPMGNPDWARRVGEMTRERGMTVSAYGSYYEAGKKEQLGNKAALLDNAVALGTNVMRVWAGDQSSAACSPAQRERIEQDLREIVRMGAERGIRIATEFHVNTLTDETESAKRMLEQVPGLYTLWQAPEGWSQEKDLASLTLLRDRILNLHVYVLDEQDQSLPLAEGKDLWPVRFRTIDSPDVLRYATLEFVLNGTPEQFLADTVTLKQVLTEI